MNKDYLCHIIRDIFQSKNFTVIYGSDYELREKLASSKHSVGAYMLYTSDDKKDIPEYAYHWLAGINHPYFTPGSCDLFISINYDPIIYNELYGNICLQLNSLLKSGGIIFLINPGMWASKIDESFIRRNDIEKELKRYAMLKNEKILVYENI